MNFLGMGPMELLLVLALALIVFGPAKLPEIGGQIGRAVRDFRRMSSDLSEEFNRNLQIELDERRADGRVDANGSLPLPQETRDAGPAAGEPSGQPQSRRSGSLPGGGDDDLSPPY